MQDTNHIESFWHIFKASVRSTHFHISPKSVQRYVDEFALRSNHRPMKNTLFDLLMAAV